MAVIPAFAQSEDTQAQTETQAPPSEVQDLVPGADRQSKPSYAKDTP